MAALRGGAVSYERGTPEEGSVEGSVEVSVEVSVEGSVEGFGSRARATTFRGGLVFMAHRLLYHPTLGLRVIKKKKDRGTF